MKICLECKTNSAKKYVREYCRICYNKLLKTGKIFAIKKNLPKKLTYRQKQIINGLLLGDGHIEKRMITHNAMLKVERSIKDELYLLDNFKEFENICSAKPRYRKRDNIIKFMNFSTRSTNLLNSFHNKWYIDKIKILPANIGAHLTPLTCAIWFCDDGFIYNNRNALGIRLCTHSFSELENKYLCDSLNQILKSKSKFKVSKIKHNNKYYFILYGAHKTAIKFFNYIKKDIPLSMNRKMDKLKEYCKGDESLFNKLM